jgi:hypothetical protein
MESEVMMLGGLGSVRAARVVGPALGSVSPRWTTSFLPPARTTPQEPQNLLRQTYMNGLGEYRVYSGQRNPTGFLLSGLGAGLQRTVAIGLGRLGAIEGPGPTPGVLADVDEALMSFDIERGLFAPTDPFALEKEILDQPVGVAQQAAQNADAPGVAPPVNSPGVPAGNIGFAFGSTGATVAWGSLATVSALASMYHGYKRNNSLGWGLWWGLMGATFPLIAPTVGFAQGWAKRR